MQRERYPGEAAGLRNFLAGLFPVVARELGSSSLLYHAIRRALQTGSLADLRRARQMFNLLPRDRRRALSGALIADGGDDPASGRCPRASGPWVVFEGAASGDPRTPPSVRLDHRGGGPAGELEVFVRPGTLPSVAARTLRRIAQLIERDRRLLSGRFWLGDRGSERR